MSQSGFRETCIQDGDGLLESNREDLQTSLDKFIKAEKCLFSENSLSFSSSTSLKTYRERYFQLLFVTLCRNLTKSSLKDDTAHNKILREIVAFQDVENQSYSSFRFENNLIEASVSYVNQHCAFQQDLDADAMSDEKKLQLLSNIRNALLRLATVCQRQSNPDQCDTVFISSQALLELQVETIDAAQVKSLESASHLDLEKSCTAFKTLLNDFKTLQPMNSNQNCLKELLHIGRINGCLFIAAGKIFFETVAIVSGLMKETEFQLQSSESLGSEEVTRYDEALFNFSEAKCSLLSLIKNELTSDFEDTFRRTFYLFVQALFCFLTKIGQRNLDVVALNSLEEKILNVLKGSFLADRTTFVKVMAQFHGYVAERMEAADHSAEGTEGDAVVNDLMMALTAQNVMHRSISAEDIFLFVSEVKRQRCVSQIGDVGVLTDQSGVLKRLNEAVTKFLSAVYSGKQVEILEIAEAHDSCLASLWTSRMFPFEVSHHLRTPDQPSEYTTATPESILDLDILDKTNEEVITSSTEIAVRCHMKRTESQTSGVCDSSDRDEMTAVAWRSSELVSVSAEVETTEEVQQSRLSRDVHSDEILPIVKEKDEESFPVISEEKQKEEKLRDVHITSNRANRQKTTKRQNRRRSRLRRTSAIITEAAQILRELKKTRCLFSTALIDPNSSLCIHKEEKEKEAKDKNDEKGKETERKDLMKAEEKKEEKEEEDIDAATMEEKEKGTKDAIEEEKEKKETEARVFILEDEKEEDAKDLVIEKETRKTEKRKEARLKTGRGGTEATELKEKEEENRKGKPGKFVFQKHLSKPMQLRAAEVSAKSFSTSALVQPSFGLNCRPPLVEPTCVRLDRHLCTGPTSRRQVVETRDAAFSRLARAVMRGQNFPIDARPEAFCAEVTSALRDFVSAHQRTAAGTTAVISPVSEPEVVHRSFADDLEIEPKGDGSFVTRKRRLQAPPKAPRGSTPLYGRCRI